MEENEEMEEEGLTEEEVMEEQMDKIRRWRC